MLLIVVSEEIVIQFLLFCLTLNLLGIKMILQAVGKNLHLTYFNISQNSLYHHQNNLSVALTQTIQLHACLIHLDLSSTQLMRQQIFFLMQEIDQAPQIAAVHLSTNFLQSKDRILIRGLLKATGQHPLHYQDAIKSDVKSNAEKIRLFHLRFLHQLNIRNLVSGSNISSTNMLRNVIGKGNIQEMTKDLTNSPIKRALGPIQEEQTERQKYDQSNKRREEQYSSNTIHRVPPQSSNLPPITKKQPQVRRANSSRSSMRSSFQQNRGKSPSSNKRKIKFLISNLKFNDHPFQDITGRQSFHNSFHQFSFYGEGGGGAQDFPYDTRSNKTSSTEREAQALQAMPYHNRIRAIRQQKRLQIEQIIRFRQQMKWQSAQKNSKFKDFNFNDQVNVYQKLNRVYKSDMPHLGSEGKIIFTRILGHQDIPGANNWVDSSECWICNKWSKVSINLDLRKIVISQQMPPGGDVSLIKQSSQGVQKQQQAALPAIVPSNPQVDPSSQQPPKTQILQVNPTQKVNPISTDGQTQEVKTDAGTDQFQLNPIQTRQPLFQSPPQIPVAFEINNIQKRYLKHDEKRLKIKRDKVERMILQNKPVPRTNYVVEVMQDAQTIQSRRIKLLNLMHPQIMPIPFNADTIHNIIVDSNTATQLPQIIQSCYDQPQQSVHQVKDEDLFPYTQKSSDFDTSILNSRVPKKKLRKAKKKKYNYAKMVELRGDFMKLKDQQLAPPTRDEITIYSSFNNWQPLRMHARPQIAQVYDFTQFMPPGDHLLYFIKNETTFMLSDDLQIVQYKDSAILMNMIKVEPREASIQANKALVRKKVLIVKKFDKSKSVFKMWKEDTEQMLNKMVELDVEASKIRKYLKNQDEVEKVKTVFKKYFGTIKSIFLYYASISSYPRVSWNDFTLFSTKCNFISRQFNLSTVDIIFKSAVQKGELMLNRFQFLQIIVRIAGGKYKDSGICPSVSQGLQKLINQNIIPNADTVDWSRFRQEQLYNTECHLIFNKNLTQIKKIYNSFTHAQKKQLNGKDVLELINGKGKMNVPDKSVMISYGSSKMSCIDIVNSYEQQKKMLFVEFLQFLGRCAKQKFGVSSRQMEEDDEKNSPRQGDQEEEELPGEELYWKIDKLLQVIFKAYSIKMPFSYIRNFKKERGEALASSPEGLGSSPSPDTMRQDSPDSRA